MNIVYHVSVSCYPHSIFFFVRIHSFMIACVSGVEALVGWLLDHPDVHITDLSDADTVSDEYSDEEVLEELEEPEPAFPVVCIIPCTHKLIRHTPDMR